MTEPSGRKIHVNLDLIEKEQPADAPEPFVFVLGEREFTIGDPRDVDWQDMRNIEGPEDFARYCMSTEDRKAFLAAKLSTRGFNHLFKEYQEHYGLDTAGNGRGSRTL